MKKLFAMFLALTMTFQLITPAWADVAEAPEEVTEETEVVEEVEETEEETEGPEETLVPAEELPQESAATEPAQEEAPAETEEQVPVADEEEIGEPVESEPAETLPEEVEETAGLLEDGVPTSGICGENLTWTLDADRNLVITGFGDMFDYGYRGGPWRDQIAGQKITVTEITLPEGLTAIGEYAFSGLSVTKNIYIPESVRCVGRNAFSNCSVPEINYSGTTLELEELLREAGVSSNTFLRGASFGVGTCGENLTWTLEDEDSLVITGSGAMFDFSREKSPWYCWRKQIKKVILPEGLITIGSCAFEECTGLTDILLPEGVTSVGSFAFYRCSGSTSVSIPSSAADIGDYAFSQCTGLMDVLLPEGVTHIGKSAFWGCSGLTSMRFPNTVTSIGEAAFSNCSGLRSVTIPASVTNWGNGAFSYCGNLTDVSIENGVTCIGEAMFTECSSLVNVSLPDSVVTIGAEAFYRCGSLTNMEFPQNLEEIESYAFAECSSLQSVHLPESVITLGDGVFSDCSSLADVTIPEGVGEIKDSTFAGCGSLTEIQLPKSVTSIGAYVFASCGKLKSISIPEGQTYIGERTFYRCSVLTNILLPEGVTGIGEEAFAWCTALESITIPRNLINIGNNAFSGCAALADVYYGGGKAEWKAISIGQYNDSLTEADIHYVNREGGSCGENLTWVLDEAGSLVISGTGSMENYSYDDNGMINVPWYPWKDQIKEIVLPDGLCSIGSYAFSNCSGLTSIDIPYGVTTIGQCAFYHCDGLTNVAIPYGMTTIEKGAFMYCSGLTSISIPDTVVSLGANVFQECTALETIKLPKTLERLGWHAFMNCGSLKNIEIPAGVRKIEFNTFSGCGSLASIRIPSSVETIETNAFWECTSLKDVFYESGEVEWANIRRALGNECLAKADMHFNDIASGKCGEALSWKLTADKTLTIFGSGRMDSYRDSASPWHDYRKDIETVVIGSGVEDIGWGAFRDCYNLTEVQIPYGVMLIRQSAFQNCRSLRSIEIPESMTGIYGGAFSGCINLKSIRIPGGVTKLWDTTFLNCRNLTTAYLYKSMQSIGENNFAKCGSLTDVYYNGSESDWSKIEIDPSNDSLLKAKIHSNFSEDISGTCGESLTWVLTGDGTLTISGDGNMYDYGGGWGDYEQAPWFGYRESIVNVVIGPGVTAIGREAFAYCENISNVSISEGVGLIKQGAFLYCTSLRQIDFPESLTEIWAWAFMESGLESVAIPEGVTEILWNAFNNCANLNSVYLPRTLKQIEGNAFYGCNQLKDVYYNASEGNWKKVQVSEPNDCLLKANFHFKELRLQTLLVSLPDESGVGSFETDENGFSFIVDSRAVKRQSLQLPIVVSGRDTEGQQVPSTDVTYTYTVSNPSVADIGEDGYLIIKKAASGQCLIKIQSTDPGKTETQLRVAVRDMSPRLESTKLTLNTNRESGVAIGLVECYGNAITEILFSDERFLCSYMWDGMLNRWTVYTEEPTKNGTYSMDMCVRCVNGREYNYPMTIQVKNDFPKITVRQLKKLNLFYAWNDIPMTIFAPGASITSVELTGTEDFVVCPGYYDQGEYYGEEYYTIQYADSNNIPTDPSTKGILNVYLDGYRVPASLDLDIATVTTAPTIKLSASSSTINTALSQNLSTSLTILNKTGQPLDEGDVAAWSDQVQTSVDENRLTLTLNEAKNTTATLYVQASNWAKPIKLTHKITVSSKLPTLKPAGNLALNSLFAAHTAEAGMVLSQSNVSLSGVDFVSTAKEGSAVWTEAQKLALRFDGSRVTAKIADPEVLPKAGTYSFKCTGTLETGNTIPGGTLKVTVSASVPKVKLSASTVKLNRYLAGQEQGNIQVSTSDGYQVIDFAEKPDGMSFDKDTGILTVMLQNADDIGGTYPLYPVVRDEQSGQSMTLSTKLPVKVQAYNSEKLDVTLSAKGKLDTQMYSEILYTVTKLNNCLGTVESVTLEGPDQDMFHADLDMEGDKPVVHLSLTYYDTYATNKGYKIQFRFTACGKEILSPMQTVKVTQTAPKIVVPKTVTYYPGQIEPVQVTLESDTSFEWINLGTKTDRDFLKAMDWISWEENALGWNYDGKKHWADFWIPNPDALTAGKSYTVYLDAKPNYNAANVPPVTIKLTVKVQK